MERLTVIDSDGNVCRTRCDISDGDAWNKLAEYEKPGLTPEEVRGLANANNSLVKRNDELYRQLKKYWDAEEQGLLIKLPCKIGDTVFEISEGILEEYSISSVTGVSFEVKTENNYNPCLLEFNSKSIGTGIFLTREAAEAALQEGVKTDE
jgi:hypothetical protein